MSLVKKTGFDVRRFVQTVNKTVPDKEDSTELVEAQPVANSISRRRGRIDDNDLLRFDLNKSVKRPRL